MPILRYVTFLCHQQWPSEVNIQRIANVPILFLSGSKDELIPPTHMRKLFELCDTRGTKEYVELANGMHNDTCIQPGYYPAIEEFLKKKVSREEHTEEMKKRQGEEEIKRMSVETCQLTREEMEEKSTESFLVEEIELEE